MILKKVNRAISFNQDEWLKPHIQINNKRNKLGTDAKDEVEKHFFKVMNKAAFGKTMENMRDIENIEILNL